MPGRLSPMDGQTVKQLFAAANYASTLACRPTRHCLADHDLTPLDTPSSSTDATLLGSARAAGRAV